MTAVGVFFVPAQACGLRNCETLDVSHNTILELLEEIEMMKSLVTFDVSFNKLKALPDSIGMCVCLAVCVWRACGYCPVNHYTYTYRQ